MLVDFAQKKQLAAAFDLFVPNCFHTTKVILTFTQTQIACVHVPAAKRNSLLQFVTRLVKASVIAQTQI